MLSSILPQRVSLMHRFSTLGAALRQLFCRQLKDSGWDSKWKVIQNFEKALEERVLVLFTQFATCNALVIRKTNFGLTYSFDHTGSR